MKRQVIKYLYTFKDRQYHKLNEFLKENFSDYALLDIRSELFKMTEKKIIEVDGEHRVRKLGQHIPIPEIHPINNVLADLDNWVIMARLSIEEKDKLDEEAEKQEHNKPPTGQSVVINAPVTGSTIGQTSGDSSLEAINSPAINDRPHSKPATMAMSKLFVKIAIAVISTVIGGLIVWFLTKN